MPIRGPIKDGSREYWTIDNVVDGDGKSVRYYDKAKAEAALRAIKAKQHATASAEEITEWVLMGVGRDIVLTELDLASAEEKRELEDVELLRIGSYTDTTGKQFEVTDKVLENIVDTFSESIAGNIDHESKGPACGWVQSLKKKDKQLLAKIGDISSAFWGRLKEKEFVNRSVEVSEVDGTWQLNGFAWLGAKRPAVKGMAALQFANEDGNIINISLNKEDNSMPEPAIATLQQDLGKAKHELSESQQAQSAAEEAKVALEVKLAESDKTLKEAQTQLQETSLSTAKVENSAYLDKLIVKGQLTPAIRKAGLDELMLSLSSSKDVIKLSEKDKAIECSPLDTLKRVLEAVPENPSRFSEQTGFGTGIVLEPGKGNQDLAVRVDAYKAEHKCTEDEAVDAVTRMAATEGRSILP